jgi:ribosomal protein L32
MDKYPALKTVSVLLKIFGWAVLVFGGILLCVGILLLANGNNEQSLVAGMSGTVGVLTIGAGVVLAVMGLLTVAAGELAGVLIDIEFNTRTDRASMPVTQIDRAPMSVMTCKNCGSLAGSDHRFCMKCGVPLELSGEKSV